MDNYNIIHTIALGASGSVVSKDALEEAGVNIDALIESGHIEYANKPTRAKAQTEE